MGRLFIYELKKVFSNRLVYILLIIFLIASNASSILPMIMDPQNAIIRSYDYEEFVKNYGGKLTQNNYSIIMYEFHCAEKYYNENEGIDYGEPGKFSQTRIMDYYLLQGVIYDIEYIIKYADSNAHALKQAQSNIELYKSRNDTYMVNQNKLILDMYSQKPALKIINTNGWFYLNYNTQCFFILILLVIFISPIFSSEHENKMHPLIYSSVRGKKGILIAKLLTAATFAISVSVIFGVFNCGLCIFRYVLTGFSEYIQNYSYYTLSPFNITLGEYIAVHTLLIAFGSVCFSLIICLISAICKNGITSIAVSAVVVMGLYALLFAAYLPAITGIDLFYFTNSTFYAKYLSVNEKYLITGLLEPHQYFTGFKTVKFFDWPILTLYYNIILSLIKCILLVIATALAYCRPKIRFGRRKERSYAG